MIDDLSRTLKEVLSSAEVKKEFPFLGDAEIEFVRPTNDYKPKSPRTVCLFLYDIRENRELRNNEPFRVKRNGQSQVARPPLRVDCCYLITAWLTGAVGSDGILQEHQLLSEVLQTLARYSTIPAELLQGRLIEQSMPLPVITAQAEGLKNISEFWTAIGSNLRPSLNLKATIAMQMSEPKDEDKPPVEMILQGPGPAEPRTFGEEYKPATQEVKGQINDEGHNPVPARVEIVELGLSTIADSMGQYSFGAIPIGKYNLRINWKSGQKIRRRNLQISVPGAPGAYDLNVAFEVKGQVRNARGTPITITIVELTQSTTTDSDGKYSFGFIPIGKYHLLVNWKVGDDQKTMNVEVNVSAAAGAYDFELKG